MRNHGAVTAVPWFSAPAGISCRNTAVSSLEKIVIGVDETPQARAALEFAALLAIHTRSKLVLAHVVHDQMPSVAGWDDFERGAHAEAERLFKEAVGSLGGEFDFETRVPVHKSDAQGLIELARAEGAGMIVVGSSHRGTVGRVLAGSVATRLLHGAPCPVAVVPRGYSASDHTLQVFGVGFDGGDESRAALRFAVEMARVARVDLKLIGAVPPAMFVDPFGSVAAYDPLVLQQAYEERIARAMDAAVAAIEPPPTVTTAIETGDPAEVLAEAAANDGVDVLIVGSHGYGPAGMVLMGSVAGRLTREAPCPVIVVPRDADG